MIAMLNSYVVNCYCTLIMLKQTIMERLCFLSQALMMHTQIIFELVKTLTQLHLGIVEMSPINRHSQQITQA